MDDQAQPMFSFVKLNQRGSDERALLHIKRSTSFFGAESMRLCRASVCWHRTQIHQLQPKALGCRMHDLYTLPVSDRISRSPDFVPANNLRKTSFQDFHVQWAEAINSGGFILERRGFWAPAPVNSNLPPRVRHGGDYRGRAP